MRGRKQGLVEAASLIIACICCAGMVTSWGAVAEYMLHTMIIVAVLRMFRDDAARPPSTRPPSPQRKLPHAPPEAVPSNPHTGTTAPTPRGPISPCFAQALSGAHTGESAQFIPPSGKETAFL